MMDAPGEYAPRFLATSQSDLTEAMKSGKLREDLFYRLSGATLHVPALRDRVEDIELLAAHFLERADPGSATPRGLSEGAKRVFSLFAWPGNVRQLEHAMRQLALTSRAPEISQQEAEQIIGAQPATDVPATGSLCADPARSGGAADPDRPVRNLWKSGKMRRSSGHQPQYPAKKDHRPRYRGYARAKNDVKAPHNRGHQAPCLVRTT